MAAAHSVLSRAAKATAPMTPLHSPGRRLRLAHADQALGRGVEQSLVAAQQLAGEVRLNRRQLRVRALVQRDNRLLVQGADQGPLGDDAQQPRRPPAVLC